MGELRCRVLVMSATTDGGADAVSAINGTSTNARSSPIRLYDFLNSIPLYNRISRTHHSATVTKYTNHSGMQ